MKLRSADSRRSRQQGQSMVEYTVVVMALITALIMPLPDALRRDGAPPGENAVESLERAIRDNYQGYSYAVSMSEYPDYQGPGELSDMADAAQKGGEMMINEFKEFPIPIETGGIDFEGGITFGDVTEFLGF